MASSMLTGDRRWAPTRKLTVLGKVPKPINLPSQRLENHGLDPNVEIVPKGTLTWGSRPSTTVPNAWGTSSSSPTHIDGRAGSPSHRPSSGGGTRPSTAGSDRSHEPVSNAWGPNSRPSSASGVLASSQIAAAGTRPRSADTRPGSSQLSRFADNSVDSTGAWGTTGTAEKLGTTSAKSSGFTLSSGDFPSLGSDKNSDTHSQRGHSSQGRPQSSQGRPQSSQGRPASASGADSKSKEFLEPHGNRNADHFEHGTVNTWKADNPPQSGYSASSNMDNWHRDTHQGPPYPNMNMPPPHYDSWHNPTFHPANGAWYRGGAPGGPYRPPGPPGGYPIDYPHAPSRPLSHPQFPGQDAGPGGFYPNNCEPYRPYMPSERYMGPSRPDVPVRHGAYPGPMPCEAYYGPPRPNFYNSTERDTSVVGMVRPVVHNQYPAQHQNYDPVNFHARPGEYGSMNKEHREPDQAHENQGPYRVLLKQHDGSEERNEAEKTRHAIPDGMPHIEKGKHSGISSQKGDRETKRQAQETVVSHRLPGEAVLSRPTNSMDEQSTDTVVSNSLVGSFKVADDGLMRRPEAVNVQSRGVQQFPVIKKNASLMEKVETLNTKARLADSHSDGGPITSREKRTGFKDVITGADHFSKVSGLNATAGDNAASTLNVASAIPKELNASEEDKSQETDKDGKVDPLNSADAGENARFLGQKKVHVSKNVDYHAKSRSARDGNDEWMKKPAGSESSMNTTGTDVKGRTLETNDSREALEQQEPLHAVSGRDALRTTSSVDPVDHKAQRAKMKEIAIQRAKQLQQEEEERTREQKAKALAKLEELNRRTLAESSNLKSGHDSSQSTDILETKQESEPDATPSIDTISKEASTVTLAFDSGRVKRVDDCGVKQSTNVASTGAAALQPLISCTQSSEVSEAQSSLSMEQESNLTIKNIPETNPDIHQNTIPKQKQVSYRKKHSNLQDNSTAGKHMNSASTRSPKVPGEVVVDAPSRDALPNIEDPSVHHKRKNNRSTKSNKTNKQGEDLTSSTSSSPPPTAEASENPQTESGKTKPSGTVTEAVLVSCGSPNENVGTASSGEIPDMPLNQGSESTEDACGRPSNYWKPHPQRKTTRNQQPGKPGSKYHATDAVMWAPVKPPSKNGTADEVGQNSMTEPAKPAARSGNDPQNGLKAKRAEIERYVPKPVAKELSQQVNSQQASPSLSQAALGYVSGKSETGSPSAISGGGDGSMDGKAAAAAVSDTKHGDNPKYNKNGRANASWRQRGSAQSPPVEGAGSSDRATPVQKASDQLQTSNLDNLPQGQLTHTDDGWNDISYQPSESVTSSAVGKSYGGSRQRRQPNKVHRVTGSNHPASENMDSQEGTTDRTKQQSPVAGPIELEGRNTIRNESQSGGFESTKPHWQPKSPASNHGRQGNRGNRAQRVASDGPENAAPTIEDTNTSGQRTTVVEARDAGYQEPRRERKVTVDPAKDQITDELVPDTGHQREQPFPLGGNQRGQHYGRFQRGYDPNYRGRESGQETNKQSYGDRRRSNQNVEYQRIRSYDKAGDTYQQNPNAREGAHEPSRAPGSRYRERGRHSPRGGSGGQFYGRGAAAAAQVGDSYNGGE